MGTVVHAGSGRGVVVATGARTEFGKIAAGLSTHQLDTEFQVGLRKFSMLLVYVAGALTTSIFVINVVLHKPIIDALLFSLAIAVGITPQLLPAVVSTSLAAGSRRMSRRKVLVKRLVCIEDLGNVDVLFTDKTGTLTRGPDRLHARRPAPVAQSPTTCCAGACCAPRTRRADGNAVGGNPLDQALWDSPAADRRTGRARSSCTRLRRAAVRPRPAHGLGAASATRPGELTLVTKGAPESGPAAAASTCRRRHETALDAEFAAGNRVVAVATRPAAAQQAADARGRARPAPGRASWSSSTRPSRTPPQSLRRLAEPRHRGQGRHRRQPGRRASRSATTSGSATAPR